ncbi:Oidioi.mRNA.OKI2018_I69.PAR.g9117.t1.cds [Oikopleura dioica]|uniref:Oidioi.mRNA.OKI2018_I69.PAR.g9117.t1.cds n=1 Tax=Oikopleura dioica TaxID=34765 RepID=A0ABN7RJ10_OIKDI|nr:Oidioi.mRNA.OKI2018_I69.PAR.g9117.t1.cds [Oikopleura dioica]
MKVPILALLEISGTFGTPPWHFARHHRYQSIARTPDAVVTLSMMKGKLTAGNIGQQLKDEVSAQLRMTMRFPFHD